MGRMVEVKVKGVKSMRLVAENRDVLQVSFDFITRTPVEGGEEGEYNIEVLGSRVQEYSRDITRDELVEVLQEEARVFQSKLEAKERFDQREAEEQNVRDLAGSLEGEILSANNES